MCAYGNGNMMDNWWTATGIIISSPMWATGLVAEYIYHTVTGKTKPENKYERYRYHLAWAFWPFTIPEILYFSPLKNRHISYLESKLDELVTQRERRQTEGEEWTLILEEEIIETQRKIETERQQYNLMVQW